jgi:RNA-directed DNA polymerase
MPTMYERARQGLIKLALEPEWEARFEVNSSGFRPGRSCHDAIGAIFSSIGWKVSLK